MNGKLFILALLAILLCGTPLYAQEKVYVFAAASTTNVVGELIDAYRAESGTTAQYLTSFASSSTLARQIEAGAEVNVYISANMKWFKWLDEKQLIDETSASILAANALVLIAAPNNDVTLKSLDRLPQAMEGKYLALGDYNHVPAGMYAKEALEHTGLWEKIRKQLVLYPSVRVALNSVDTAQADFGIVYRTDAILSKQARLLYTFPEESHTPIRYPIGAIKGKNNAETQHFLAFLKSDKANGILEKYGFVTQ